MIRLGETKYKNTLKAMWRLCFPQDTEAFIRFYFIKMYKNEETLIYVENDQAVASLQMIPFQLKTGQTVSLAGYISGAMTHPDFRKKGYMEQLLKAAFAVMKEKGYDYTFLIPQEEWLFDFYEKYGYIHAFPYSTPTLLTEKREAKETAFFQQNPGIEIMQAPVSTEKDWKKTVERYWHIYSAFLMEKPNVVLKNRFQFTAMLLDFFNEKGILFVGEEGMAFTVATGGQIMLKEFFYRNKEVKRLFLASIRHHYANDKIVILNDPDAPVAGYKGMIKCLNDSQNTITDIYMRMMLD
ncbi:MAG: GNAT family N-acetyltransferase [Dysgonamonadaceae bacterium]|jgi:GNAT superfamily N-acetyltransferase|nr:GNAT family N-acetyltransferase [Dysgonamonadaceae bacterium]